MFCGIFPACSEHQHGLEKDSAAFGLFTQQPTTYVSANFGPDGRLWRVSASKQFVFVDVSSDNGKTFSSPITVNPEAQHIKASSENRPSIAVDGNNHIYVVYAAEGVQPATLLISSSIDGGKTFSSPKLLSDKANEAITFQGTLAINRRDQAYVFWHDDRDRTDYKQLGNSVYYTTLNNGDANLPNQKASDVLCECCRLAVDFDTDNQPVVLGRFIYDQGVRDHGLLKISARGWNAWRVTHDDWRIEACPEQGPVLSISDNGDYHMLWLTQGNIRRGLFYANSQDHGLHFSTPMAIGKSDRLPNNPAVIARGKNIAMAWNEFDGEKNQLYAMQSQDGGLTWSSSRLLAESSSTADKPYFMVKQQQNVFLAWTVKKEGFRLFEIK